VSEWAKAAYIERVRYAMQLLAEELTPEEYIAALGALCADLEGMIDAAAHAAAEQQQAREKRKASRTTRAKGSTPT